MPIIYSQDMLTYFDKKNNAHFSNKLKYFADIRSHPAFALKILCEKSTLIECFSNSYYADV